MIRIKNIKGFTIIELLVAMAVFSTMLGLATIIYVQVNQQYLKGTNMIKSQEAARNSINELTRKMQLERYTNLSGFVSGLPERRLFCVGNTVYFAQIGTRGVDAPGTPSFARWEDPVLCNSGSPPGYSIPRADASALVDGNVSFHHFQVAESGQLITVQITTAFGALDTLTNAGTRNVSCINGIDSKFCGISSLDVTVTRRVEGIL